ncbi:MAG: hypothetical protein IJE68_01195 [Clostridia bacterium]|nr:hypothetical protein [Clostridia bacterium]
MNKIIRYYNQNRRKIFSIIIVIASALFLLYFINYMVAKDNINQNTVSTENQTVIKNNININSAIGGGNGGTIAVKESDIIEQFIKYCNEGQTVAAYNMLSYQCKEIAYPKLESFINNYYNNNFDGNKSYNIQRWSGSTYKVDLKENILHTGNITVAAKQDFITVINEEEEYKLNINSFIGRTNLNKEENMDNISIKVAYKNTYMNDETYTLEVENKSSKDIYLDNLEKTSTIYIVDENDVKHTAYINEIAKEQLHIYPYAKNQVQIKFSNSYVTGREFTEIVFENVMFDDTNNESEKISINLK